MNVQIKRTNNQTRTVQTVYKSQGLRKNIKFMKKIQQGKNSIQSNNQNINSNPPLYCQKIPVIIQTNTRKKTLFCRPFYHNTKYDKVYFAQQNKKQLTTHKVNKWTREKIPFINCTKTCLYHLKSKKKSTCFLFSCVSKKYSVPPVKRQQDTKIQKRIFSYSTFGKYYIYFKKQKIYSRSNTLKKNNYYKIPIRNVLLTYLAMSTDSIQEIST
eukprot:TRINITY_DN3361_c0_g1_i1.p2 TRINITY_DN3361_c0_g1~~TRINITY_DN3361_c0_g1_i1.p2  ORF type:complete len:213 (+),score=-9.08 TRINITY_DN3361_c0_g1_i1:1105-1743(+)